MVVVAAVDHGQAVVFGVLGRQLVFKVLATSVHRLHRVHLAGHELDAGDIKVLPEGVGVDHEGPLGPDEIQIVRDGHAEQALHLQEPVFIQPVGEEVAPLVGIFPAEEDFQAQLLPRLRRDLPAAAEHLDLFAPAELRGHGGIAAQEVVGDADAVEALVLVKAHLFLRRSPGAAAALGGVHMCFVSVFHVSAYHRASIIMPQAAFALGSSGIMGSRPPRVMVKPWAEPRKRRLYTGTPAAMSLRP